MPALTGYLANSSSLSHALTRAIISAISGLALLIAIGAFYIILYLLVGLKPTTHSTSKDHDAEVYDLATSIFHARPVYIHFVEEWGEYVESCKLESLLLEIKLVKLKDIRISFEGNYSWHDILKGSIER
jgi:hypothetical protein